jgi:hypothetical protein
MIAHCLTRRGFSRRLAGRRGKLTESGKAAYIYASRTGDLARANR